MVREIARFTPAVEAAVTNLRRLSITVGGARELWVGADGRIRPEAANASGSAGPVRIRPYVSVFLVGKSGRRLEAPGLAVESGPPKPHLSAMDSAPVWNESFQLALSAETLGQASALVLVVMDGGQRGLFGASSSLLGGKTDVPLAQARMEWVELVAANMIEREAELPLLDESGRKTGASLTVRTEYVDLVACRREQETLKARLTQARYTVDGVLHQRRLSDLRVRRESEILEAEMELDARQSASADAAKIMKEMQTQLMSFVEAEEELCANAEAEVQNDIQGSVATLDGACDDTVAVLNTEKHFYDQHAPELHETIVGLVGMRSDEFIAAAQQANLRLIRVASDGMAENLRLCEGRLHQATDYQIVLQRDAVERAKKATLAWSAMPAETAKEELAHAMATWQVRQQALKAESLAVAAALHSVLVESKVAQDDEGVAMRDRQQRSVTSREEIASAFMARIQEGTLRIEEDHQVARAEFDTETVELQARSEQKGRERIEHCRAALSRVEAIIGDVDGAVHQELNVCEAHAATEAETRAQLVDSVHQRRLQRLCTWIAETEEDGRQLEEVVAKEEGEALARDAMISGEMGSISLVEARSRDLFDRARVEHITNVALMHDQLLPVFAERQADYEKEMHAIRDETNRLSEAAVGEHIHTVRGNMAEVVHSAASLRRESREKQIEVGTQLLVLHLEQLEHAADANKARMNHAYTDAMQSVRLGHARISTSLEVALLRERNTQHFGFNQIFAQASEASWARERAQLLAAVNELTSARQATTARLITLAEEQTLRHFDAMALQMESWAEQTAADEQHWSERLTAQVKAWEEEPAKTAQAQLASQRRLMAVANDLLTVDAEWFTGRLQDGAAEGAKRADDEIDEADELVAAAQKEWRQQVAEGFKSDMQAHHERLLNAERQAHADALQRAEAATQRMEAIRDACSHALDSSAHRATLVERQLENARSTAAARAERTREKLQAAHDTLNAALDRTKERVEQAALSGNEAVLKRQREVGATLLKHSTEHTVLVERAARERHDQLLTAYHGNLEKRAVILTDVRSAALRGQEVECRKQLEGEEALESGVAQVTASASAASDRAIGVEESEMSQLWAEWLTEDAKAYDATKSRALDWQHRANSRFLSQLASTWGRQRVHHANLCRETQRARRIAFERRRQKRQEATMRLQSGFNVEQRDVEAALTASREALAEDVSQVHPSFEASAQRALDALTARRLRDVTALVQRRYEQAADAFNEDAEETEQILDGTAEASALLLAELTATGTKVLGPPPNDFVRHAVAEAVRTDAISEAVAWTEHWEAEQAAAMRDGVDSQVLEGLQDKRERRREALTETKKRAAARELEQKQKAEDDELKRLLEEEKELAKMTPADLEEAARERAELAELEWAARSMAAQSADVSKHDVDRTIHERRVAHYKAKQRQAIKAVDVEAMGASAAGGPTGAAQVDLAGAGLQGEHAVTVMRVAANVKGQLQKLERDESSEAFKSFQETVGAMKARMQGEVERVVEETRVRREAQLVREIERAGTQVTDLMNKLSSSQLVSVMDGLAERAAACDSRADYEQHAAQRALIDQRKLDAKAVDTASQTALRMAKLRLDNVLGEADARITSAEIAARLAAETPLQRRVREQMAKNVHKLSGLFAAADASGDGMVDKAEFRQVLPILAVDGATEMDADAVFLNLSRGQEQVGYRDLFLELSRIARQQQADKSSRDGPGTFKEATPPQSELRSAKPTPRAASAAKGRPGAEKTPSGAKKAPAAKPGAKKPTKGGARAASAPKQRGTPLGQ